MLRLSTRKILNTVGLCKKTTRSTNLKLSRPIWCIVVLLPGLTWFHTLSYFSFFTDQPRNPWQMLAEPLGSAEPRLKITALGSVQWCCAGWIFVQFMNTLFWILPAHPVGCNLLRLAVCLAALCWRLCRVWIVVWFLANYCSPWDFLFLAAW